MSILINDDSMKLIQIRRHNLNLLDTNPSTKDLLQAVTQFFHLPHKYHIPSDDKAIASYLTHTLKSFEIQRKNTIEYLNKYCIEKHI